MAAQAPPSMLPASGTQAHGVVLIQTRPREDWPTHLICTAVFLLPLACWPGPGSAFAMPKMVLLALLDLVLLAAWLAPRIRSRAEPAAELVAAEWLALAWVAVVSVSALTAPALRFDAVLLALLPAPIFWWIARGRIALASLARAVWLGTTCEAAIVVLQFCGLDPLRVLGWQPEGFPSPRMRAYGTMGNPDFVAAWCCAALPLAWQQIAGGAKSPRAMALRWGGAALQMAAILATGSRVFVLAIVIQAAWAAWRSKRKVWLWALPFAAALLFLAPARPVAATVQGRLYLARVTAAHWQTPVTGYGPGSFEERFAVWQAEWLQAHGREPGAARFAGPVDHVHNDYLEFLVDLGPLGLLALVSFAGCALARHCHGQGPPFDTIESAAVVGAATLCTIAAVDFPFHRPAEWSLLWLFLGILASRIPKKQGA
jgi:O-antigen ligase/polysaccharide polymerase Wzy-like membrane protein